MTRRRPTTQAIALHPPRFIKGGIRIPPRRREPTAPFTWPLRAFDGIEPSVLASHRHGVDLGYAPAPRGELWIPVHAANDSEIACVFNTPTGCAISLDHGGTWTTHYTGLAQIAPVRGRPSLQRRDYVRAGEVIGYATTPRIGFELWQCIDDDRGLVAVDPIPHLSPACEAA